MKKKPFDFQYGNHSISVTQKNTLKWEIATGGKISWMEFDVGLVKQFSKWLKQATEYLEAKEGK